MTLALEINDAGLLLADAGGVLLESPGYALLERKRALTGEEARGRAWLEPGSVCVDFWRRLDSSLLPRPTGGISTRAGLVFAHLESILGERVGSDPALALVAPGCATRQQLALLLGMMERLSVEAVGMLDTACAASRLSYPGARLLHLDADLHRTLITPLVQGREMRAAEPIILDGAGLLVAERLMTQVVAAECVAQFRFDPLHDAAGEQQLHDRLPQVREGLLLAPSVDLLIETGGAQRRIELSLGTLTRGLKAHHDMIIGALAGLPGAGQGPQVIQVTHRLAVLPGLLQRLAEIAEKVVVLEKGAAAMGALAWVEARPPSSRPLPFTRVVDAPPEAEALIPGDGATTDSRASPTHLLVDDSAYALTEDPLEIGRDPPLVARHVRLEAEGGAVSRHHCSIAVREGRAMLLDRSRFGTWVNDRRVTGATPLRVGDRLRLADADLSLRLIGVLEV